MRTDTDMASRTRNTNRSTLKPGERLALERNELERSRVILELDADAIDGANSLLQALTRLAAAETRGWEELLRAVLTDAEYEVNLATVSTRQAQYGWRRVLGAIEGGTGTIRESVGHPGEEGQRALQILKASGRIVQCGKGRGKCLVVLTDEPLSPELLSARHRVRWVGGDMEVNGLGNDDVPALLEFLAQRFQALTEAPTVANEVISQYESTIESLRAELAETQAVAAQAEQAARTVAELTTARNRAERAKADLEVLVAQRDRQIAELDEENKELRSKNYQHVG